jgi:hypothetical protein
VALADGPVGRLSGTLLHHPCSKGLAQWLERHCAYAEQEAAQIAEEAAQGGPGHLLHPDPALRRAACKRLFHALPGRPLLRFAWLYLARGGFLDGGPGLAYALLQAQYESLIRGFQQEARLRRKP